jgi:hypothetical protein
MRIKVIFRHLYIRLYKIHSNNIQKDFKYKIKMTNKFIRVYYKQMKIILQFNCQ